MNKMKNMLDVKQKYKTAMCIPVGLDLYTKLKDLSKKSGWSVASICRRILYKQILSKEVN